MKKIQIKIDKDARVAALYISGKLILLSIPEGWSYFYICNSRIDSDDVFISFLNAVACETEDELELFKPCLKNFKSHLKETNDCEWHKLLERFKDEIIKSDDSNIRTSHRAIALVYKHKLTMFVKEAGGFFFSNGTKINGSSNLILSLIQVAISETKEQVDILTPMLDLQDPNWKEKAQLVKDCLRDDIKY